MTAEADQSAAYASLPTSVMVGRDEYLFLVGGSHSTLDRFCGNIRTNKASVHHFVENLSSLTAHTVLTFGDSFFRGLLVFLSLIFRRVVFCRTRFFQEELVKAVAPDVIFCGMAERYLSGCTPDQDRKHFLALTFANGRGSEPTPNFPELWERMIDDRKLLGPSGEMI